MNDSQPFETCDACGQKFEFGMGKYYGRKNLTYDIMVCRTCDSANWDGWNPHTEPRVTARLLAAGKPLPARLPSGLLPRD